MQLNNFSSAILQSIFSPKDIYKYAQQFTFKNFAILYLIITFCLSISLALFLYNNTIHPTFSYFFNEITEAESIEIYDGEAIFSDEIDLPHIRSFSLGEEQSFYYILDGGENIEALQEDYQDYLMFGPESMYIKYESQLVSIEYDKLEDISFIKNILGDPMVISGSSLSKLFSLSVIGALLIIFPPFIPLPLGLLMGSYYLASSLGVSLLAYMFSQGRLPFRSIFKASLIAALISSIIMCIAYILMPATLFNVFWFLAIVSHFLYLYFSLPKSNEPTRIE